MGGSHRGRGDGGPEGAARARARNAPVAPSLSLLLCPARWQDCPGLAAASPLGPRARSSQTLPPPPSVPLGSPTHTLPPSQRHRQRLRLCGGGGARAAGPARADRDGHRWAARVGALGEGRRGTAVRVRACNRSRAGRARLLPQSQHVRRVNPATLIPFPPLHAHPRPCWILCALVALLPARTPSAHKAMRIAADCCVYTNSTFGGVPPRCACFGLVFSAP
jgi:hypothetical protein